MGHSADRLCAAFQVGRREQDEYAIRSHTNAKKAEEKGYLKDVVPLTGTYLCRSRALLICFLKCENEMAPCQQMEISNENVFSSRGKECRQQGQRNSSIFHGADEQIETSFRQTSWNDYCCERQLPCNLFRTIKYFFRNWRVFQTDGASACLITTEEKAKQRGWRPKAYLRNFLYVSQDPKDELLLG